jgi:hypothetical protein
MTNSQPGNTGYLLASFRKSQPRHRQSFWLTSKWDNTNNRITPIIPGISVTLANNATSLIAGQPNLLILSSMAVGIALDGAMLHARTAAGIPVGTYSDAGGVFVPFPGCGKNKQGQFNGVVHQHLITCNVGIETKRQLKTNIGLGNLYAIIIRCSEGECWINHFGWAFSHG